ncbi:MAG: helix-turn-helix transcriptional regulator [Spirochaetaceae bacterium]|nr:helix-turn-helix transcriptional regulator [Spirochaetaceae bacterium]
MNTSKINSTNPFYNPEALSSIIFKLLNEKNLQNNHTDVYKRAGLSRANFSNYISGKNCPTQEKARRLIVGLKCSITEAEELLSYCGYSFVHDAPYDNCLKECLQQKIYNYTDVELYISKKIGYYRSDSFKVA